MAVLPHAIDYDPAILDEISFLSRVRSREVVVPRPKKKAQAVADERNILDEWIPSDPSRPVYTALRTAFIERFAEYYVLLTATASERSRTRGSVSADELDRLDKESMQLAGLLFSRSNLWAVRDFRKPAILKFLLRTIRHTRGDRPATKLQIAVLAKEMKLADSKKWTWPKITAELCDCRKDHTIHCQDNLRREVLHLRKIMNNLGCTISI